MEQTVSKSKPWNLPFWFILGIMIANFLENLFVFKVVIHVQLFPMSWPVLFAVMLWPSIILIEAIIYWLIRKRIEARKWVWAHLLFSLFAFVLLWVLYFIVLFLIYSNTGREEYSGFLRGMKKIQQYAFWSSVVGGHIFFVVTIVRSFSHKSSLVTHNSNDFLSELPG